MLPLSLRPLFNSGRPKVLTLRSGSSWNCAEFFELLPDTNSANVYVRLSETGQSKPSSVTKTYWTTSSLLPSMGGVWGEYTTIFGAVPLSISTKRLNASAQHKDDDDPSTRRSEGGHVGSIPQTHQANDDLEARRTAITTHTATTTHIDDDPRGSSNGGNTTHASPTLSIPQQESGVQYEEHRERCAR